MDYIPEFVPSNLLTSDRWFLVLGSLLLGESEQSLNPGSRFRVRGSGFRVQGSGLKVEEVERDPRCAFRVVRYAFRA